MAALQLRLNIELVAQEQVTQLRDHFLGPGWIEGDVHGHLVARERHLQRFHGVGLNGFAHGAEFRGEGHGAGHFARVVLTEFQFVH